MYDGILDDMLVVEVNLRNADVIHIDFTKIFELLKDLKNPNLVSQILIEAEELRDRVDIPSISASNDFVDDQNESDVEVIKEVRKEDKIKTVDLTETPDEHFISGGYMMEKKESQDFDACPSESMDRDSNEDSMHDESTNQNDYSNDYDDDNYYTTSDYEDPDVDKKETDKMKAESPPPILSILKDLCENPRIPVEPVQPTVFEENIQMENSEILEENNNDPNNNNDLEEIQMVEPVRSRSPVAGCSRDFNEREPWRVTAQVVSIDGDDSINSQSELTLSPRPMNSLFCQESIEPKPGCSKEYIEVVAESSTENGDDIEILHSDKSSQTNYEQLIEETELISKLFPDVSGDRIFSMLDKYKKATNRVTVVLWNLLPRERPEPNFPKKRKSNNDFCSTERKKSSPLVPSSPIDHNIIKKIHNTIKKKEVHSSVKREISEYDSSSSSTDDTPYDHNNSDNNLFNNPYIKVAEVKNHHHKDFKGKNKSKLRSSYIQPPKFNFHPNPVPEIEPKPVQKHAIIAPPKLIFNQQEKQSNVQQAIEKPMKRKLGSATRELTEEGFVIEGTETVNTASNAHAFMNSKIVESDKFKPIPNASLYKIIKKLPAEEDDNVKSKKIKKWNQMNEELLVNFKKPVSIPENQIKQIPHSSANVGEIPLPPAQAPMREIPEPPVIKRDLNTPLPPHLPPPPPLLPHSSLPPPSLSPPPSLPPQRKPNFAEINVNNTELETLLNQYFPVKKLETAGHLDFLNPTRKNQFYKMPRIDKPPPFIPSRNPTPIINQNDPRPSTSSGNPLRINENYQQLPMIIAGPSSANPEIKKTNENTEIPCKDTYYKLRSIFPDVDPEFIKQKCINPPFNANGFSKEQQLNLLVEILLTEGTHHCQVQEIKEETNNLADKDVQYENLLEIFPEADPTYLREFVDKNYLIPDNMKDFVAKNLEKPDYPTRAQVLEKVKITEQIKQYTTDFDIKKFLQIFPDPVAHFENPNRICEYNAVVYEFLRDVFCKYKNPEQYLWDQKTETVVTISQIYRKQKHHLSLTAANLRQIVPDMKTKRNCSVMPTENIPLLQEMAYVRHKTQIVAYLEQVKKLEENEFQELKTNGMLLECQCCFNDECMPSKCSTCEAGHLFCHACIVRGTESKMGDGQNHITCFSECKSEFSLSVLQKVLPPTTLSILLQKRQEAEVKAAGLEGLVSCPFCHFASIPPPESKVFKCLNPECMKETCRLCKELNHVPLKCDEVIKTDQARRHLEEKMTEALVRTCYNCQKQFFKEEGCNKMTCVCGASMCYLCSTPLKLGQYSHFNGQGAANSKLCPLWSDNRRMNAEAVRKVAEMTENEIRKLNPNLQLNAQALLPALPPKTRGPHDDIPNANQLPEHIRRVAHINP